MGSEINYRAALDHIEKNVLVLKMKGLTQREIAKAIDVTPGMISKYMRQIRLKLHADNNAQAAARYLGWRGLEDD